MIVNALDGKSLPVYGDGSIIRDWLYVEDHVRGIDLVIKKGAVGETYNIGGNEEHANLDIVSTLCVCIDDVFADSPALAERFPNAPTVEGNTTSSLITMVKDRPGHDWRYAIDASRIETELGFTPSYDFASGLRKTVTWMLENEAWWRAILDESYRNWIDDQYVRR
jgi:dTDP-glucose 4,6-dehydratase